ncbi:MULTISPECIES: Gfo/Idh/MocA family protein [unclassified Rhodococcus (in: high G+C Gram-positive bacteria)]|uniref:Gfo/Idh/MocA family protein n=1 Tax=unclassified Rhodococcus (in: high G+C Gram-positive bacteria) TaxID=192944 RepID=UPI000A51F2A1|nr:MULTISPECIES: Gfo/Idh/MocA family oxidoreductase [unclassified Rhodococcus (in: high G+C Gram-positive bacteria)]
MTAPLRIGVLGASRIAEQAIIGPAHALGHRLVVVAARDRGRAEAFAQRYGVERVADDYDAVIDDPEVDAVYNPLANALHAEWNMRALRAGKAVLTEKPFARNAAEARAVRDVARETGAVIVEGFHYLFHPVTRRLLDVAANGTLGRLTRVEVVMAMPAPADDDPRWSLDLAGGSVMDLGCYGLHVHRLLADVAGGPPRVVSAVATERDPGVDATSTIELAFPDGATGTVTNSMEHAEHEFTVLLTFSEGTAFAHNHIKPNTDDRVSVTDASGTTVEHLGTRPSYEYQLEAFAAHVQSGAPIPLDADDAAATMELVDAAYAAAGLPLR